MRGPRLRLSSKRTSRSFSVRDHTIGDDPAGSSAERGGGSVEWGVSRERALLARAMRDRMDMGAVLGIRFPLTYGGGTSLIR